VEYECSRRLLVRLISIVKDRQIAAAFSLYSLSCKKMKFYTALWLLTVGQASAFSAVAPSKSSASATGGGASMDPVDRSMQGIDADADAFDPTEGDSPALTRNNNDEVWVAQVSLYNILTSSMRSLVLPSHQSINSL
jgi:hypothetical protein